MHFFQETCCRLIFKIILSKKLNSPMIQKREGKKCVDYTNLIQRNDVKALGIRQMHRGSHIKSPNRFVLTRLNFIPWDV